MEDIAKQAFVKVMNPKKSAFDDMEHNNLVEKKSSQKQVVKKHKKHHKKHHDLPQSLVEKP